MLFFFLQEVNHVLSKSLPLQREHVFSLTSTSRHVLPGNWKGHEIVGLYVALKNSVSLLPARYSISLQSDEQFNDEGGERVVGLLKTSPPTYLRNVMI